MDSSDNDSSIDETEVKRLVENFSESTSSRTTPLTKEQELSQSKTIWKQVQSHRREIERTIRVNEVLPYLSNLGKSILRLLFCVHISIYSRLSLSQSRRDPLKHFEISVFRHIRFAELRKIPMEQPNFTNEYVINLS